MHGGLALGEEPEQPQPFVLTGALEGVAQDLFVAVIVRPVPVHEARAALRPLDAPPGENAGDVDDVLLAVAAIHAEGMELEELASVVLVDAPRHPFRIESPHPGRLSAGRHALRIVQIEEHGGTFRRRDQEVLEPAQRVGTDRFLYIGRHQEAVGTLADEDIEVIRPEIDHHFAQLSLRNGRPHDGELLELTAQLPEFAHRRGAPGALGALQTGGVAARRRLALHALALAPGVGEPPGELGTIVIENLELPLALREPGVVDAIRLELPLDPPHDAEPCDAVGFAGTRAIREAIQGVKRGIARGEALGGSLRGEHTSGCNQE